MPNKMSLEAKRTLILKKIRYALEIGKEKHLLPWKQWTDWVKNSYGPQLDKIDAEIESLRF